MRLHLSSIFTGLVWIAFATAGCSRAASPETSTPPGPTTAAAPIADGSEPAPQPLPEELVPPERTISETDAESRLRPPSDPTVARFHHLEAPKPATWIWHPPQSELRTANWTLPGREGSDMAELVVFAFPAGQGGTREENIQRWSNRFRSPTDEPVEPIVQEVEVAGMPITIVELHGQYMKMGAAWFTPGQMLLGAIVEQPDGLVFIRVSGPEPTVQSHMSDFMTMIRRLRRVEDGSS